MVFPKNDYITFQISASSNANFTFPTKKPKKIWLDIGATNAAFRFKINDDKVGMLIHMSSSNQKSLTIPSTVNSIELSTSAESAFFITILVEEWGN